MKHSKLRRQIAWDAARMLYHHTESQYFRAKLKAARRVVRGWINPADLPSKAEIREQIAALARRSQRELRHETSRQVLPEAVESCQDRFRVYQSLLLPLEEIKQSRTLHPEGDALYHSLQVFELARDERPYDEDFLLAALLHDAGKAIDPRDHVAAALDALNGFISHRTAWFIEHHSQAQAMHDGTLGARARRRLQQSEDYEELLLLARCDRKGRSQGVEVSELEEALDYVRELARTFGE